MLLQTYDRLGPSALDHSKDKFLVQSCVVEDEEFARHYLAQKQQLEDHSPLLDGDTPMDRSIMTTKGKELGESLTAMWNAISSSEETEIYNKKLPVKHVVVSSHHGPLTGTTSHNNTTTMRAGTTALSDKTSLEHMSPEQMFLEISSLRRKYDELVTFSVNLTAERDILNNTLEQTKRDLNREISNRGKNGVGATSASSSSILGGGKGSSSSSSRRIDGTKGIGISLVQFLIWSILVFLLGVKMTQMNQVGFLRNVPVVRNVFLKEF